MGTVHMQISIRPTASAVKDFLMDELAKGHTILPLCKASDCPDFDRKGGGCHGHETEK